jgi:hypothetical protein
MLSIFKAVVLFTLATSVSALTTPHAVRNVNHHRGVAAALATTAPEPVVPQGTLAPRTVRRRSSGRCKPKSSSSSSATLAATPAANIEGGPPSVTTTKSSAKPTHKAAKATHTSSDKPAAPSKQASSPKPASSNGGNQPSYMAGTQTGQGTYYGTGLGACGITNNDSQHIAAVSHLLFDTFPGYDGANPNKNPVCGQKVTATYQGKSVDVTITDRCVGCKITDLDFSPSAFSEIADQSVGRISGMKWHWSS